MYRIFVYYLLLASVVLAAPRNERHKRHFSYIIDYITSTLSEWYQRPLPPFSNIDPEDDYVFYEIPGYENILIKAKPNAPMLKEIVYQPEEVLEIKPFESYLGTKNAEDTLIAFQNVDNLFATKVFSSQETDLLKETMVPIISSLGEVTFVTEDLNPWPSLPDDVHEVEKPNKVKFKENIKEKYDHKQIFPTHNNLEVTAEEIDRSSILPLCLKQRIDEVVLLCSNPLVTSVKKAPTCQQVTSGQDPFAIKQFSSSRPDGPLKIGLLPQPEYTYGESIVPLSDTPLQLNHFNEVRYDAEVNVDLTKMDDNLHINNSHTFKDKNDKIVMKNNADSGEYKNESHNVYKNISRDNLSNSRITKQKDEEIINVDFSLSRLHVNDSSRFKNLQVNNKNVAEDIGKLVKPENIKENYLKSIENETLSEYIHELETDDKLKPLSIAEEKNELKTHPPHPRIKSVHVSFATNIIPVLTNDSKITITDDNVPKKSTLTNYIYEHVAYHNPPALSAFKETDESKSDIHKDSSQSKLSVTNLNTTRAEKASEILNINDNKTSTTRTDFTYKVIRHDNSNITGINNAGDELKTNAYPDYLLPNINTSSANYTKDIVDELVTNKITTNSENYSTEQRNYTEEPLALMEDFPVSFKNHPVVVADSNYVYHQNNVDGSMMKVKGNKDGVSIDVTDQYTTERGDIPGP